MSCKAREVVLGRTLLALEIENDLVATTVLLDKGADIYRLIYKPTDTDVMWKAPWGLKETARGFHSASDSMTAWLEAYGGGWQVLFPNGGFANTYKGVELGYHGEASMKAWVYEVLQESTAAIEVRLCTRLARSPYTIERWMRLEAGCRILRIRERITNHAGEAMGLHVEPPPGFRRAFPQRALRHRYRRAGFAIR